jgi:flagellar protein FliO/FliZ
MDALILGLRVVVALGAVLGLMWFLQRRLGKGTGRRRADRALTIVSRQSLGQKASVVVVDAAGQRFLLGVTEHAVNVLHTGDIPPEPEEVPVPALSRSLGDFARILAEARPDAAAPLEGTRTPDGDLPPSRRSSLHRNSNARGPAGRGGAAGHPPLHGSILAGSTWKQAAAALRSGRRN